MFKSNICCDYVFLFCETKKFLNFCSQCVFDFAYLRKQSCSARYVGRVSLAPAAGALNRKTSWTRSLSTRFISKRPPFLYLYLCWTRSLSSEIAVELVSICAVLWALGLCLLWFLLFSASQFCSMSLITMWLVVRGCLGSTHLLNFFFDSIDWAYYS